MIDVDERRLCMMEKMGNFEKKFLGSNHSSLPLTETELSSVLTL